MCYSFGYTPMQALYPAECIAYENRAKGIALQTWLGAAGEYRPISNRTEQLH